MWKKILSSVILGSLGFLISLDYLPELLAASWPVRIAKCLRCSIVCFCNWPLTTYSLQLTALIAISLLVYCGSSGPFAKNLTKTFFGKKRKEMNSEYELMQNVLSEFKGIDRAGGVDINPGGLSNTVGIKNVRIRMSLLEKCFDEIVDILLTIENVQEAGQRKVSRGAPVSPSPLLSED